MKQAVNTGAVRKLERVCVFCGSSGGNDTGYLAAAKSVGQLLARRGITLVFGGGRVGMMGAVAEAALTNGGKVIGVIPAGLVRKEQPRDDLTELHITQTMHERKQMMAELADGFIALPGGFGTFEEFCEVITWAQLGIHTKPCGLLNVAGYYDPLVALFDRAVSDGFIKAENRGIVVTESDPEALIHRLNEWPSTAGSATIRPEEA